VASRLLQEAILAQSETLILHIPHDPNGGTRAAITTRSVHEITK
jgi:hypothetical protein